MKRESLTPVDQKFPQVTGTLLSKCNADEFLIRAISALLRGELTFRNLLPMSIDGCDCRARSRTFVPPELQPPTH
jgi:hypothetical protein